MTSQEPSAPVRRRARTRAAIGLSVLAIAVLVWAARHTMLVAAGRLLVAEDPLAPVDVIAVSSASWNGGALEAAQLYRSGFGAEILLMPDPVDPADPAIRQLGIRRLYGVDLAEAILERSGVPARAVRVLPDPVDGTDMEIAELASFARQQQVRSMLFITARTHTRRARWLLRHTLPPHTRSIVRASGLDDFSPDTWWYTRGYSREVVMEYLRWVNTTVLRDLWGRGSVANVTASPAFPAGG